MAEIGFYHLTRTRLDRELPKLLGRTLAAQKRAFVLCREAGTVTALDKLLWEAPEPSWLPHGSAADGDPDLQPIWLGVEAAPPNGATFLFLVDGADAGTLDGYERVFDLFDGNDETAVGAARQRWRDAKAAGHALTYWQQGPQRWEKKA